MNQSALIERIKTTLQTDRRVHALFLSGSFGCGTADGYSAGALHLKRLLTAEQMDIREKMRLKAIEADLGCRLGVAALDTEKNRRISYRATDLWPLCSTFKFLLVGAVLAKVDSKKEQLDRAVVYNQTDLLDYAPITRSNLADGQMTVRDLCQAAICYSDNTAANLLLSSVDGPQGLTSYVRTLGDKTTRFDRIEPFLNEALPKDPRDTTSPLAMIDDMEALLLRNALSTESQALLIQWLVNNTIGNARLRAGLPSAWQVGDKTGTGGYGSTNDIAIVWPPNRKPVLIAVYLTETVASASQCNDALAEVSRIITPELEDASSPTKF